MKITAMEFGTPDELLELARDLRAVGDLLYEGTFYSGQGSIDFMENYIEPLGRVVKTYSTMLHNGISALYPVLSNKFDDPNIGTIKARDMMEGPTRRESTLSPGGA